MLTPIDDLAVTFHAHTMTLTVDIINPDAPIEALARQSQSLVIDLYFNTMTKLQRARPLKITGSAVDNPVLFAVITGYLSNKVGAIAIHHADVDKFYICASTRDIYRVGDVLPPKYYLGRLVC